ncbi:hypothetical protein GCM10009007_01480 [Formosimonas limnophila]|uniref:Uncharacterized protein n=1 Tax=Formosimonas limnophila TaxID=1384487 RepID=A0A8J3FZ15_9BURK|nr:hypothetical protein GCM10009007_01480 [Formosimonas limnophila]
MIKKNTKVNSKGRGLIAINGIKNNINNMPKYMGLRDMRYKPVVTKTSGERVGSTVVFRRFNPMNEISININPKPPTAKATKPIG